MNVTSKMTTSHMIDRHCSKVVQQFVDDNVELFRAKVSTVVFGCLHNFHNPHNSHNPQTLNYNADQEYTNSQKYPECFDHEKMLEVYKQAEVKHASLKYRPEYTDRVEYTFEETIKSMYKDQIIMQSLLRCNASVTEFIDFIKLCNEYDMPIVYCCLSDELYPSADYYKRHSARRVEILKKLTFITSNGLSIFRYYDHATVAHDHTIKHFSDYFNEETIKSCFIEHAKHPRIPVGCYTKELIEGYRMGIMHQMTQVVDDREKQLEEALAKIVQREERLLENIAALKRLQDEYNMKSRDVDIPADATAI